MTLREPWSLHLGSGEIGIDIDGRWMCAAQVRLASGGSWYLQALVRVLREQTGPLTPTEARRLCGAIARSGAVGRTVVAIAPRPVVVSGVLDLPPRAPGVPIDELARVELARSTRMDAATLECGVWDVPPPTRAGHATHVLAVGAPHSATEELIDTLEGAGLDVAAIEPACLALSRLTQAASFGAGHCVVVEVGWAGLTVSAVRQGVPIYQRMVQECGVGGLYALLQKRLGTTPGRVESLLVATGAGFGIDAPDERTAHRAGQALTGARGAIADAIEAMAGEVARSVSYVQHRYGSADVARITLVGEGAHLPGLRERLEAVVKVGAEVGTPATLSAGGGSGLALAGASGLCAALGAAVRSLAPAMEENNPFRSTVPAGGGA